jgi:putative membrane protein
MTTRFLLAGAAALALAACGRDADDTEFATDETAMADQGGFDADTMAADALPTSARSFIARQAESDLYEVEAGRLAEQNGQSQQVRDFGAMMVRDHTDSTESLRRAAQASGVAVDPRLTAGQESGLAELRRAGENFDSVYKQQRVAAHQLALAMLRNYADNGDNQALQDFARETAATAEGHLNRARELP